MTDQLSTNGQNEEREGGQAASAAEVVAGTGTGTGKASAAIADQAAEQDQAEAARVLTKEERTWAMACHISTFSGFAFPCGHIFAPMIIRAVKAKRRPLIDDQAKESVNFQITMSIILAACIYLKIPMQMIWVLVGYIGLAVIFAAYQAKKGVAYRYPLAIRFLR